MNNFHKFQREEAKFASRLLFEEKTPDQIASAAFEGKSIDADKPASLDVDALAKAAYSALDAIPKDKRTDADYQAAKLKIETGASSLKNKQKYFTAKSGMSLVLDSAAVMTPASNVDSYMTAKANAQKFQELLDLRTAAGVTDDINYIAKKAEAEKTCSDYVSKITTDLKAAVKACDDVLNPVEGAVVSDEQKGTLKDRIRDLNVARAAFMELSSKDAKIFPADALEASKDAFNINNSLAAKAAVERGDAQSKEWAAGAEQLNKSRVARRNAMALWQQLLDAGDSAKALRDELVASTNPAQIAWEAAQNAYGVNYETAATKYNEAAVLYKEAIAKINNGSGAEAAKSSANTYWEQNIKGKGYEKAGTDAGAAHWKLADDAMKSVPPNYVVAKTNFDLAKADYESFVAKLKDSKTEKDVKDAETAMNAAKATFESTFKVYPQRKGVVETLVSSLPVLPSINNDMMVSRYNVLAKIYTQAVVAINAWQKQQDAFKSQSGMDATAHQLYIDAEACFARGDFAAATDKYNEETKIYEARKQDKANKPKSLAMDDKGQLREFTQAEAQAEYDKVANVGVNNPEIAQLVKPCYDTAKAFWDKKPPSYAAAYTQYKEIGRLYAAYQDAKVVRDRVGAALTVGEAPFQPATGNSHAGPRFTENQQNKIAFNKLKEAGDGFLRSGNFADAKLMYEQAAEARMKVQDEAAIPAARPATFPGQPQYVMPAGPSGNEHQPPVQPAAPSSNAHQPPAQPAAQPLIATDWGKISGHGSKTALHKWPGPKDGSVG